MRAWWILWQRSSFLPLGNRLTVLLFSLFIIFGSIAAALALSAWIGKMYAGFLIVAGIYLLIGIIVWNARERLLRIPIMNSIINQMFKEDDDEKD